MKLLATQWLTFSVPASFSWGKPNVTATLLLSYFFSWYRLKQLFLTSSKEVKEHTHVWYSHISNCHLLHRNMTLVTSFYFERRINMSRLYTWYNKEIDILYFKLFLCFLIWKFYYINHWTLWNTRFKQSLKVKLYSNVLFHFPIFS